MNNAMHPKIESQLRFPNGLTFYHIVYVIKRVTNHDITETEQIRESRDHSDTFARILKANHL